jgi:hypothetical protein
MHGEECAPVTTGGNSTLTNGNEQKPLDKCVQVSTRTEGMQDAQFHPAGKPGA